MQSTIDKFGPLIGRVLLAAIFLMSGIGKIGGFAGTAGYMASKLLPMVEALLITAGFPSAAGYMASKGLPMIEMLLAITIVIEIGAALMIIGGFKARLGATALFLWMIPVTLVFHNFWAMPASEQMIQQIMFMKNLGLMGGMLYIMAFGSGPMSVDKK